MVLDTHHVSPAKAFDAVADIFDEAFENERTKRLRNRIYREIERLVPPGSTILDINCGTGTDALALLERGYKVTGIDISPRMVEVAAKKVMPRFPEASFLVASFDRLESIITGRVNLVLSGFGGLNCVKDLRPVASSIASVLQPGGLFLAVFMPRFSLWEAIAGLLRADASAAFRRLRGSARATGFCGIGFEVFYHDHRSFLAAFGGRFTVESVRGINILSPPPHAAGFVRKYPRLSGMLEEIEELAGGLPGIRSMGDHSIITLRFRG
jgi:SAM-dependent methyltransferase